MVLTYEETLEITKLNETFKMKHENFGNTTVAQCTYFLASANDFFDAKKDKSMIRATELRGITYVNKNDGKGWKSYLFIDKFFNINQTNGSNVTSLELTINGKTEVCNINKLFINEDGKIVRALDLKENMKISEYNRVEDIAVGELYKIESLSKEVLPTIAPENSWMYEDVKDLNIERVANKDDGSAIRFLIINNELIAKTKFSFQSEQTKMAMKVVNAKPKLKAFILKTLELELAALFEIVSPDNKIVLSYNETNLKLLQLREEKTGRYLNIYDNDLVSKYNITTADEENLELLKLISSTNTKKKAEIKLGEKKFTSLNDFLNFIGEGEKEQAEMSVLDLLLLSTNYIEEKEGFVVTMDGKMAKIKHRSYMELHGLLTGGLKEHKLILQITEETIDDVIAQLPEENISEREFVNEVTEIITNHINHLTNKSNELYLDSKDMERKEIVMKYKSKFPNLFPYIMMYVNGKNIEQVEKQVSKNVQFNCRKLNMAKNYLKNLGFEKELKILEDEE